MNPYLDELISHNTRIRSFIVESTFDEEYVWHRDEKDRIIEVLEGKNWFIQYDNQLPKKMIVGERYEIPSNRFHRLLKGTTNLILRIEEI